jgi:hypothetical protein
MTGARGPVLGAIGIALLLAGCRDAAGPEPILSGFLTVYGVLEVESPLVKVLAEEVLDAGGRQVIRGAQAVLSSAFGSTPLIESAPGLGPCFATYSPAFTAGEEGCYAGMLLQAVGPSETLTLGLILPHGSEVRGTLVTPEAPVAWIPPDSQRVSVAFLIPPDPEDHQPIAIVPVVLDAAPGGHRVDVVAKVVRAFPLGRGGEEMDPRGCQVDASTAPFHAPELVGEHDWNLYGVLCREGESVVPWDSLLFDVHVISMEQNLAGYMNDVLGSNALDATRAGFGLDGAVGVFGAVATTVLPLTVFLDR